MICSHHGLDLFLVEGLDLAAPVIQGAVDAKVKFVGAEVLRMDARSAGHQHGHRGQLFLDHQVGGQGGAQHHALHPVDVQIGRQGFDGAENGFKQVGRVGGDLDLAYQSFGAEEHRVGMGSAYVESNDHAPTPERIVRLKSWKKQPTESRSNCQFLVRN